MKATIHSPVVKFRLSLLLLVLISCNYYTEGSDVEPSIVGGVEAPPFKYSSWTVGLLHPSEYSYYGKRAFCGAAYIGKDTVLTVARKQLSSRH